MNLAAAPIDHGHALREAAERTMTRLGLAGFDNASIVAADAWVDSVDFRAWLARGIGDPVYELGAYLGEALIRRHGGTWTFVPSGPRVELRRNGHHVFDPMGRARRRVLNGRGDHLVGLVHLVGHVVGKPRFDPHLVAREAYEALSASDEARGEITGVRAIATRLFGPSARRPFHWPGTLGAEAHETCPSLEVRLLEKVKRLHVDSCQDALAEVAFYTAQLREVRAIAARRDPSPGRGYIGFDVYGGSAGRETSWSRYAL